MGGKEKLRSGSRANLASKKADGKQMAARSNCGSESDVKTGICISIASSFSFRSESGRSVGPSTRSFVRIRAKKKDFLRASPTTQYFCELDSIAPIEGAPSGRAAEDVRNPVA